MPATVEREGRCICHREPLNGENGMEGYNAGEEYRFQVCFGRKGRYVRVYHNDSAAPGYYETCGPVEFLSFFRVVAD